MKRRWLNRHHKKVKNAAVQAQNVAEIPRLMRLRDTIADRAADGNRLRESQALANCEALITKLQTALDNDIARDALRSADRKTPKPTAENRNRLKRVVLYTDGSCIKNPGPGGWACLLRSDRDTHEMFGCEAYTTNNRMELRAVIQGLKAVKERSAITIFTDSQYVQRGITKWLKKWKGNGWRTCSKTAVLNQDLWVELDRCSAAHTIRCRWVRGHENDVDNLRCDSLATRAAREQLSSEGIPEAEDSTRVESDSQPVGGRCDGSTQIEATLD